MNKFTDLMPEMTTEEYESLKEDVKHKGILEPLLFDQDGQLIDGKHRFRAFSELIEEGVELPMFEKTVRKFTSDEERIDTVLSANLKRRHMTVTQRRELVAKLSLPPYSYTMPKIAELLGKSIATIWFDIDAAPDEVREAIKSQPKVSSDGRTFTGGYAPRVSFVSGERQLTQVQSVARGPEAAPETKADKLVDALEKWKVEPGQVWYIPSKNMPGKSHRLMCGSSLNTVDLHDLLLADYARLVVTSPPYNQDIGTFKASGMQTENTAFVDRMASAYQDSRPEHEYQADQMQMLVNMREVTTPDAAFYYNHKNRIRNSQVLSPLEWLYQSPVKEWWKLRLEIVWDRSSSMTLNARMYIPCDERIYWLVKDPDNFYFADTIEVKAWTTVWRFAARNEADFSAPFPNELPRRCIIGSSEQGDIVLDPYSGTGTTITECERLSRVGYGMEINPRHVAGSLERLSQMGLEPTLAPF